MKLILNNTVAVIDGDTHHAKWVEETGRLDHDRSVDPLVNLIPVGGIVVDGGANIGTLTKMFLDRVGCNGTVYAFEPNPEAFACLRHNCPEAQAYQCGLSDRAEYATIVPAQNAGATYLRDLGYVEIAEVAAGDTSGRVPTASLDSFALERCDFLKLDIEGYEGRALFGAQRTLQRCKPLMFIEVNDGALQRIGASAEGLLKTIAALGYEWKIWQPECKLGDPQFDVLCKPKQT